MKARLSLHERKAMLTREKNCFYMRAPRKIRDPNPVGFIKGWVHLPGWRVNPLSDEREFLEMFELDRKSITK